MSRLAPDPALARTFTTTHGRGQRMDQLTFWSHTVTFAPDPGSVARARDFVCAHLLVHGLSALVDDVRLVASELTTNAVMHARTPVTVSLTRERHSVLLRVQDGSPRLPRPADPDPLRARGRGLVIVDELSSGWGVELADEAKAVWARFDTGRTMPPAW